MLGSSSSGSSDTSSCAWRVLFVASSFSSHCQLFPSSPTPAIATSTLLQADEQTAEYLLA
jgi:hypothetical protein